MARARAGDRVEEPDFTEDDLEAADAAWDRLAAGGRPVAPAAVNPPGTPARGPGTGRPGAPPSRGA